MARPITESTPVLEHLEGIVIDVHGMQARALSSRVKTSLAMYSPLMAGALNPDTTEGS